MPAKPAKAAPTQEAAAAEPLQGRLQQAGLHRAWQESVGREEKDSAKRLATPSLRPLGPFGLGQRREGSVTKLAPVDENCSLRGSALGAAECTSRVSTAASLTSGRPRSRSQSSLSGAGLLLMFNDGERKAPPRLGSASSSRLSRLSGTSSLMSSASHSSSVRREVAARVQEEVARAMRPLTERLESERKARLEMETMLSKAKSPTASAKQPGG
eukprot:TRINITY_DN25572_c0_g1_i1.p1 TRINITY_DN25572_c0_g1~~TRINITY_DN25572_c0_g1_i1.p1  ORF type:complete len:214 (+),score=48.26 TRINITY_DN25572_c0_g1_i1:74-715(+)